jgi:hypothetical protein
MNTGQPTGGPRCRPFVVRLDRDDKGRVSGVILTCGTPEHPGALDTEGRREEEQRS